MRGNAKAAYKRKAQCKRKAACKRNSTAYKRKAACKRNSKAAYERNPTAYKRNSTQVYGRRNVELNFCWNAFKYTSTFDACFSLEFCCCAGIEAFH